MVHVSVTKKSPLPWNYETVNHSTTCTKFMTYQRFRKLLLKTDFILWIFFIGDSLVGKIQEVWNLKAGKMDYFNAPGRNHLFVPGPVNIPDQIIRAMNRNNEDYRSPAIPAMTKTLLEDVKKIFKTTTGTPFLIPTTGIYKQAILVSVLFL